MTVFVLKGVLIEDGTEHPAGSFLAGRAGTSHGPHAMDCGCILLTTFSANLDFICEPSKCRGACVAGPNCALSGIYTDHDGRASAAPQSHLPLLARGNRQQQTCRVSAANLSNRGDLVSAERILGMEN